MKKNGFYMVGLLLITVMFACKKEPPIRPGPIPPVDTATQRTFRLVLKNLPDQPAVLTDLTAVVTIKNTRNEIVRENKILQVRHNQQYVTDTVNLPKGNYNITSLLVMQGDTAVRFASPIAGSAKATAVNKPLAVSIALDAKTEKTFDIEVLTVANSDTAESFGYPPGTFGNRPGDPGAPTDKKIFIRPLIKIGDIVYDSVPVQLILKSWDSQNNMTYSALYLPAGLQSINLPANGIRYQLSIAKWGTNDELNLIREEVKENTIYVIGGSKDAKKLKTVYEYKLSNGTSTPQSKTDFEYQGNGQLKQMIIWGKHEDMSNYIVRKDLFEYQNSKITRITGYDENNVVSKTSSFNYNGEGRIVAAEQVEDGHRANAAVSYMALDGSTGISQDYRINIQYTNSNQYYTSTFTKDIRGGNVTLDLFATSHGNLEEGRYGYDFNINPYAHLAIPDIYFSQYSKHNQKAQTKTYHGAYPMVEAYSYSYTYDQDGYPTELLTKYKTYQTNADAFTIRTVFVY